MVAVMLTICPMYFFKIFPHKYLPFIVYFRSVLLSTSIPSDWAMGIVFPIFKKVSTGDVNNYRPISLTCISWKIMESVIKDTMLCHLSKHKLITKHQHRFLFRNSTTTQLLECVGDWTLILSNKQQVDVAYLDFIKASTQWFILSFCIN